MRGLLYCLALLASASVTTLDAHAQTPPSPATPPAEPAQTQPPPDAPLPPQPETTQPQAPPSQAPDSFHVLGLSQIETEHMRLLYFGPAETYLTPYVGRSFENAFAYEQRMFAWQPWETTTVLLKDFSDYGNAAARASPNNAMILDIAPLSLAYETFSPGERFFTLTNHELTHVALMDVWNGRDAFWREVFFGKPMPVQEHPESILYNYLAAPRVNVPRWYLEGSAVFMETWMAGGFGRAQGAYDEMVFRAMVRDDAHFYSPVGLESQGIFVDFQVGVNDYLYGTRFFSYLAYHYSPEQVVQWLRRDPGSEAYYQSAFEQVFGTPLNQAWRDWIAWEHQFQAANLASVHQYPLTEFRPITERALGSVSRTYVQPSTGDIVGAFRYPGVLPHIGVLAPSSGEIDRLTDIEGAMLYKVTSLAYDPQSNTAWYTTDNYAYRDIMQLDVATGRQTEVLHDSRIGDIVFDPADRSLWGIRHLNGYATLVHIPAPYTSWSQVHTFPFGRIPFDLDVSADGTMLSASVGEVNGEQSVQVFSTADLLAGGSEPMARFTMGTSTPEGFVFSPDGRYLYGSAYYTGVSNIYRFEIATQDLQAVSNASTGFFRPIPQADGSLIVYEYTGQGFRPGRIQPTPLENLGNITFLGAQIAEQHPVVQTWAVGSPSRVPLDSMITAQGPYNPSSEMRIGAAYPVLEGYRGRTTFGYHVTYEDPLQFNQLQATLSYLPNSPFDDQDWHLDVSYHTLRWNFRYWHNDADFYDLFGPTERARAGDAGIVGYHRSLIYDPPRQLDLNVEAAYYTGLDTLPGAQEVSTGFDTLASFSTGLNYTHTVRSLGAVDHEKGLRWNVDFNVDYANDEAYPSLRAGLDVGVPLPVHNSSVWLYTAAGVIDGPNDASPLNSFYMGAFGNNYVDDREIKRYREYDSFPGFDINEIDANSFVRVMGELNLPPVRFEDLGIPSFYLSSMRPAFFAGDLELETSAGAQRSLQSAGVQLDWNFTVAHRLPMVISIGHAWGFEDGEEVGEESLISLKIM
ncbi:YncE family protein [Terricaulis sp.]|uniref:YncE family protein n=1 Tax=Terricaulis sp. TaxID=2768686 RepID=UPI003784BCFA